MAAPARKRASEVSTEEGEEQENITTTDDTEERPPKRVQKKTSIQQSINDEKAAKEKTAYEKLKQKMKIMKAEMNALKKAQQGEDSNDDDDSDPDKTPVESEEEDEDIGATVLQPSLRKNTTTPLKPVPKASIRCCEGDPQQTSNTSARPPASPPLDMSGSPSSSAPAPPSSPSPARSSSSAPAIRVAAATTTTASTLAPAAAPAAAPAPATLSAAMASFSTTTVGVQLRPAPFHNDFQLGKHSRPNAGDYIDEVRDLLLLAIARYMVSIFTVNAFPDTVQQRQFVTLAWDEVCAAQDTPVPWQLSDRMIAVVGKCKSNARGDASDRIRPLVPDGYKFRTVVNKFNEQFNTARSVRLVEKGIFHHKKFDLVTGTKTRFAQHKFIDTAVVAAFFWNAKSGVGFEYASHFNPMPDAAIAFVLTAIHAHILEWSTGQHVQEQFTETANSGFYKGFLTDLETFGTSNASAWLNIWKRLFERTFHAGGGISVTPSATQLSIEDMAAATAEFAHSTGLTDSEGEGEGDEDEVGTS